MLSIDKQERLDIKITKIAYTVKLSRRYVETNIESQGVKLLRNGRDEKLQVKLNGWTKKVCLS